jgi:prepilin peptidase CpaA
MGGGDVKLLAACALWFDLASGWKTLVAIALAGGVEALAVLLLRRLPWPDPVRGQVLLLRRREGIPYGIAIALGVAVMAIWLRS